MKVWIIEQGEYSDRQIIGVFSTEEKALAIAKECDEKPSEWEVDCIELRHPGLKCFSVSMDLDGNNAATYQLDWRPDWDADDGADKVTLTWPSYCRKVFGVNVECWARDEQHAIKIANDRRIKALADGTIERQRLSPPLWYKKPPLEGRVEGIKP